MNLFRQFLAKGNLNKDDVIQHQLNQDFSSVAQFYDQVGQHKIGYIGKSVSEAVKWGIWKSSLTDSPEYLGFYESATDALGHWQRLTGGETVSYHTFSKSEDRMLSTTEKSVENLSSEGEWKYLQGYKVQVNEQDIIIKGPDLFIGQKFSVLASIAQRPMAQIMNLWNLGNTKYFAVAEQTVAEAEQREKAKSMAKSALEKAVEGRKKSPYRYNKD